MIQGATTMCLLVFAIVVVIYQPKKKKLKNFQKALFTFSKNVSRSVSTSNIFVALSVAIAFIIRKRQTLLIAEQDFMLFLAIIQYQIMAAILFSGFLCRDCFDLFEYDTHALGFYIAIPRWLMSASQLIPYSLPSLQSQILKDFVTQCVNEKGYLKPEHGLFFYLVPALGMILDVIIWICIVIAYSLKYFGYLSRIRIKGLLSITIVVYTIHRLFLFVMYWIEYRQGQPKVAHYSDQPDEESQWGFGQVSAVCAWLPLAHVVMKETFDMCMWFEEFL